MDSDAVALINYLQTWRCKTTDYQPACDERGILLILYNNPHKANLLPLTVDYVAAHAFAGSRHL